MNPSTIISIFTLPPARADYANKVYRLVSYGSDDVYYICRQLAAGTWDWEPITLGASHAPVTVVDTASIDLTLVGQQISAAAIFGSTATTVAAGNHTHANPGVTVQEEDVTTASGVTTLDFDGSDFNLASEAGNEVRIGLAYGTGAGTPAEGNHVHANDHVAATVLDSASIDFTIAGQQITASAIFGTTATTVAAGNHTHANDHVAATVADTASIDLTIVGQQISAAAIFGTTATTIAAGNHTHANDHVAATVLDSASIDFTLAGQQITASAIFGTTATTVAAGNHNHDAAYAPLGSAITEAAEGSSTPVTVTTHTTPGTGIWVFDYHTMPAGNKFYIITGIEWKNGATVNGSVWCGAYIVNANPPSANGISMVAACAPQGQSGTNVVQRNSNVTSMPIRAGQHVGFFFSSTTATGLFGQATVAANNWQKSLATGNLPTADFTAFTSVTTRYHVKLYYRGYN